METKIDKEFFDLWKDKKVVMHCKTIEEAEEFCKILDKNGYHWVTGTHYIFTNWEANKENTVYYFNKGMYGDLRIAAEKGCTILEFEDFIVDEEKEELIILLKDGTERRWQRSEYENWEWEGSRKFYIYDKDGHYLAIYNTSEIIGIEKR